MQMDRLLTTKEIMSTIGCKKTKLYELIKNDVLPVTKIGGRYYAAESKLDRWIKNSTGKHY